MNWLIKSYKKIILILIGIILVYLAIYIDVVLRAKAAYYNAEKYLDWHYHPEKKEKYLQEEFEREKKKLDKLFSKGKLSQEEYNIQLELLEFNKQRQLQESSLKYAYIWYKTAVELFSPPQSKWVKLAKQKMPIVKELWKKEIESKGYKVEDYMLE
ncbi:MAG: hypothetical protein RMJ67_02015 [Elusimicrobiota bacterium]|nr:hypothetical protein [Endomicrobiia bacterium]MDW8165279.1 hypothetical protein [Elusimicrobiota bacterium]